MSRRLHFGQFYRELPLPDGPLGVIHGNCQAESLRVAISGDDAEPRDIAWVRIPPAHELTAEDLPYLHRLFARAAVLVTQPIRSGYRDLPLGTHDVVAELPPAATVIRIPIIRYRGLHPWQRLVRGPGLPDPPVVPYHDVRAIARAAGLEEPTAASAWRRDVAEDSLAELRRRQQTSETLAVDDLLVAAGAAATHTVNHPGNPVLLGLAARIAETLGLDAQIPDPGRTLLRSVFAPITAETLTDLGLQGEPREHWVVNGEPISDDEVLDRQTEWLRENPKVLSTAIEKVQDDLPGALGATAGVTS